MLLELENKHAKLVEQLQKGDKATDEAKKSIIQAAEAVAKQYKAPAAAPKETK